MNQKEYEYIIKHHLIIIEEEKRKEEIRKKIINANGEEAKNKSKKKDKEKLRLKAFIEERREIQQNFDDYRRTVERIKKEKLDETERQHTKSEYNEDL